ncbi:MULTISPECIES: 50S ribosomal protein L11 methyltransferase [Thalassobaculum]|uniref:Ribosomal protein L11 methyltransferase n=1 Tax=Thalassobaculum litoreum DSM 18839 TaxID=1123362 RepID=A0A8G2EUU9_9PROT|nr:MULTISPECIES: 50S ribosomal protein L11 methyltransferase [Thalassobaculum]SDF56257.1 ribosomal protein L11 methyltransferase [Thalassobaculum litoreum DSM 18839]
MSSLWRIALTVPAKASEVVADALSPFVSAVTALEDSPGGTWTVEGISEDEPARPAITAALALAAATVGTPPPDTVIEPLPDVDWLALNRQSFPPIREGRVWIRGSHVADAAPASSIELLIDAARAFGSGSHPTTALCLRAIQDLAKRRTPRNVLDLGCGSGILAMALAKLVPSACTLAVDLDPVSVATARENARMNRVARRIDTQVSNGWRSPVVRAKAPFDLVVANILAGPLAEMAPSLKRGLAPGGIAILSGLLNQQERWVIAVHRAQGLRLIRRYRRDGWSALVFARG